MGYVPMREIQQAVVAAERMGTGLLRLAQALEKGVESFGKYVDVIVAANTPVELQGPPPDRSWVKTK